MALQAKTPRKTVTKSIRLTPSEVEELTHLLSGTAYTEAALLRQWVINGIQQFRMTEAIRAYQEGHLSLRQAAEHARLPVAVLLEEMVTRKVAVVDTPESFGPGLAALREAFGKEAT